MKEEEHRLTSNEALQLLEEKESQRVLSEKFCREEETKETETETNMKENLVHKFQNFLIYNQTQSKLGSYIMKTYYHSFKKGYCPTTIYGGFNLIRHHVKQRVKPIKISF
jgi:hypothetical protein